MITDEDLLFLIHQIVPTNTYTHTYTYAPSTSNNMTVWTAPATSSHLLSFWPPLSMPQKSSLMDTFSILPCFPIYYSIYIHTPFPFHYFIPPLASSHLITINKHTHKIILDFYNTLFLITHKDSIFMTPLSWLIFIAPFSWLYIEIVFFITPLFLNYKKIVFL